MSGRATTRQGGAGRRGADRDRSAPSVCLNGDWEIATGGDDVKIPDQGWKVADSPRRRPRSEGYWRAWGRLAFDVPKEWAAGDRRFVVEFEKVGHYAGVFCNGKKVGEHFGQYAAI